MNIKENNRLIAEFMGEKGNDTETIKSVYIGIPVNGMKTITVEVDRMKFHTSWDWLMPVVEKIESLGYWTEIKGGTDTIVDIGYINSDDYKFITIGGTKLEATYSTVVKFIEWYNNRPMQGFSVLD